MDIIESIDEYLNEGVLSAAAKVGGLAMGGLGVAGLAVDIARGAYAIYKVANAKKAPKGNIVKSGVATDKKTGKRYRYIQTKSGATYIWKQ